MLAVAYSMDTPYRDIGHALSRAFSVVQYAKFPQMLCGTECSSSGLSSQELVVQDSMTRSRLDRELEINERIYLTARYSNDTKLRMAAAESLAAWVISQKKVQTSYFPFVLHVAHGYVVRSKVGKLEQFSAAMSRNRATLYRYQAKVIEEIKKISERATYKARLSLEEAELIPFH